MDTSWHSTAQHRCKRTMIQCKMGLCNHNWYAPLSQLKQSPWYSICSSSMCLIYTCPKTKSSTCSTADLLLSQNNRKQRLKFSTIKWAYLGLLHRCRLFWPLQHWKITLTPCASSQGLVLSCCLAAVHCSGCQSGRLRLPSAWWK